jgi:dUTP pyrophosphatase
MTIQMIEVPIKCLDKRYGTEWPLPQKETTLAAGIDLRLCTTKDVYLYKNQVLTVPLGISLDLSQFQHTFGQLAGFLYVRSSVGKKGVTLANGTGIIDADYQGEIKAMLTYTPLNKDTDNSIYDFVVLKAGMRICQLVLMHVPHVKLTQVQEFQSETERGAGGFGSTGVM